MLRQYSPQRFRYQEVGTAARKRFAEVGTLPIGTIFRSQPEGGLRESKIIIEAWLPREIGAARKVAGKYQSARVARGGHLAVCRDTGNDCRFVLADHFIQFCVDHQGA